MPTTSYSLANDGGLLQFHYATTAFGDHVAGNIAANGQWFIQHPVFPNLGDGVMRVVGNAPVTGLIQGTDLDPQGLEALVLTNKWPISPGGSGGFLTLQMAIHGYALPWMPVLDYPLFLSCPAGLPASRAAMLLNTLEANTIYTGDLFAERVAADVSKSTNAAGSAVLFANDLIAVTGLIAGVNTLPDLTTVIATDFNLDDPTWADANGTYHAVDNYFVNANNWRIAVDPTSGNWSLYKPDGTLVVFNWDGSPADQGGWTADGDNGVNGYTVNPNLTTPAPAFTVDAPNTLHAQVPLAAGSLSAASATLGSLTADSATVGTLNVQTLPLSFYNLTNSPSLVPRDYNRYGWTHMLSNMLSSTNLHLMTAGDGLTEGNLIFGGIWTNAITRLPAAGASPYKGVLFGGEWYFRPDVAYGTPAPVVHGVMERNTLWWSTLVGLTNSSQGIGWGDADNGGNRNWVMPPCDVFRVYYVAGPEGGHFKVMQWTNSVHTGAHWDDIPGLTDVSGVAAQHEGRVLKWTNNVPRMTTVLITNWANGHVSGDAGTCYFVGASCINTHTNGFLHGSITCGASSGIVNVMNVPTAISFPILQSLECDILLVEWLGTGSGSGGSDPALTAAYSQFLKAALPHTDIVFCGAPPTYGNNYAPENIPVRTLQEHLRTNAMALGFSYWDSYSRMGPVTNWVYRGMLGVSGWPGYLAGDNTHPTDRGCAYYARALWSWLDPMNTENQ